MVEIIPKKSPRAPLWMNIFLYFSIALLLVSLASFFVLGNLQKKQDQSLTDLEESLAREKSPKQASLEKEVFAYQKKIQDFSPLLKAHQEPSAIFPTLESLTHPAVQLTDFSFDAGNNQIRISGITETFETLGQQVFIFKQAFAGAVLVGLGLTKDSRVEFSFFINL